MALMKGEFQYKYDPDAMTPLPRPWHLDEGKKGKEAIYPRGKARAKLQVEEADTSGYKHISLTTDLPHLKHNITQVKGIGLEYVTKERAKELGIEKTGYIVAYKDANGKTRYVNVDPTVVGVMNAASTIAMADPNKLLVLARFYYRYGFMKQYWEVVNLMKQGVAAINEASDKAKAEYLANYNAYVQKAKAELAKYNSYWNVG